MKKPLSHWRQKGVAVISKTGHSLIKEKIKNKCTLAFGEMSGHIFLMIIGMVLMIQYIWHLRCLQEIFRKFRIRKFRETFQNLSSPEIRIDCKEKKNLK